MENKFNYYALVIKGATKNSLMTYLETTPFIEDINKGTIHLNHCTLVHNTQLDTPKGTRIFNDCEYWKGMYLPMEIIAVGKSDKAIAFRLKNNIATCNKIPHITIATINGGEPKDSNDITEWHDMEKPIVIEGKITRYDYR